MAGGVGASTANSILDSVFGSGSPGTLYMALMTANPTDTGGGTEVSGFGYARVAFTNNSSNWNSASSQAKTSKTQIDWGTASGGAWGTIVCVAAYDASTAGNLIWWFPLAANKTVNNGDGFKVVAGNLTATLT